MQVWHLSVPAPPLPLSSMANDRDLDPRASPESRPGFASVPLHRAISRDYLLHHGVAPAGLLDDGRLLILSAPGAFAEAISEIASAYDLTPVVQEATRGELERQIERLAGTNTEKEADESADGYMATDIRELANEPPVVRYVNLLLRDAADAGASDVHLDAFHNSLTARFRIDGVLVPGPPPPATLQHAVISRIKLLAELDVAERRRPQDGRLRVRLDSGEFDMRVSTVPTMFGESIALRLLDRGGQPIALDDLGMSADLLEQVARLAARRHGMLLIAGPTGSGKTTTLYAALQRRDRAAEKIVSVEDPIEYHLENVTQVPVHRVAGVTFASALRSILRQDPDVVMIGEMRDSETAEIGVQAAMTGHLVFSTIHTRDAAGTIPRLLDLGIPRYLVAGILDAVLAQRLVRRTCNRCRVSYRPETAALAAIGHCSENTVELSRGSGCRECRGTGFRGRIGVFELLVVNDNLRQLITAGAARHELCDAAVAAGMVPLVSDGYAKALAGLTTVEEVIRATEA